MPEPDRVILEDALTDACRRAGLGDALTRTHHLAGLCRGAGDRSDSAAWDEAAATLAALPLSELTDLVRVGTARFHLLNKAEQLNIIHVNRERERRSAKGPARAESIDDAAERLKGAGLTEGQLAEVLGRLDIEPTLTAHPTEARRRTVLEKQTQIAECVLRLRDDGLTARERSETLARLDRIICVMLLTDDVRVKRLGVPDEIRNGIYFLSTTIWQTVPRLMRDVTWAARRAYGEEACRLVTADLPPILRYRTWIGGDRDGNPNVTAEVTAQTLQMMRDAATELWDRELAQLRHVLSISTRRASAPKELTEAIDRDEQWLDEITNLEQRKYEPIRVRLSQMRARLSRDPDYGSAELLEDLQLIRRAVRHAGVGHVAEEGLLADAIIRARVFGRHLAALDVRQHSGVHEAAIGELFALAGVSDDYAALNEAQRIDLLQRELRTVRPLIPVDAELPEVSAEVIRTMRVVREAVLREPASIRAWIISMTHRVSDLLGLLLLMKEAGLHAPAAGDRPARSSVEIVPLFETIDDLDRAPVLMDEAFRNPVYRAHLDALAGDAAIAQEIMLGYSDSNKDGGFLMANVALQVAQQAISETFAKHGVQLRFFHGRGGTIGRGGGRAGRAILAAPPNARSGRLRFTEQGEVITFRYALPDMARRHLEQIVHAALLAEANVGGGQSVITDLRVPRKLADRAQRAYRTLIDDPGFWPWFTRSSPVEHIGGLPIASRPVSRATGSELTFDRLRAIPWVFSWIQMRGLVPGWYGLGTALSEAGDADRRALQDALHSQPFLSTILQNAAQELARARMPIFRRYALTAKGGEAIAQRVTDEFTRSRDQILALTGATDLMAHAPVIGKSIADRNPYTDVLNLAQIELLGRWRSANDDDARAELRPLIQAAINGLAAAMQSTG